MAEDTQQQPEEQIYFTERMLLGLMLRKPELFTEYADRLRGSDFYFVKHEWIWDAMLAVSKRDGLTVPTTVADELRRRGRLEDVGGGDYLFDMALTLPPYITIDESVSTATLEACARGVEREAYKRRLLDALSKVAQQVGEDVTSETLYEYAQDTLEHLAPPSAGSGAPISADALIEQYAEVLLERATLGGTQDFVFEWPELRAFIPRIPLGSMVLISAFTGIGKSLLAEAMAELAAMTGLDVFFASFEMSFRDFMDRSAARNTGIPIEEWRGSDAKKHNEGLGEFKRRAAKWLSHFTFWPGGEEMTAREAFRQIKRAVEQGAKFVVVDYVTSLQFETTTNGRVVRTEEQAIRNFATRLHKLAKDNDVIIVLVSQLSQNARGEAHTRGSKALEHRAHVHIHIRSQELKEARKFTFGARNLVIPEGGRSPMRIIDVRKNRFGPVGKTELFLDGECARFISPSTVSSDYVSPREAIAWIEMRRARVLEHEKGKAT